MHKVCTAAVVGMSFAGLATGCGSSTTAKHEHPTTSTVPARSGVAQLQGSYVRTVTKADLARTNSFRHEGRDQHPPPTGVYHLTLASDTFRAADPTGFAVAQTYSATPGGHLSVILYVNPDQAAFCGPDIPQSAAYGWSLSGDTLRLTTKYDPCADRSSILQGRWTRIGT